MVMVQIPDVLAWEGLTVYHQRDRIFQVGTQRENGACSGNGCNRSRSVTTSATQDYRAESARARDGIVHSAGDRALSDQKQVGDFCEPQQCVFVFVRDRLT